MTKVAATRKRRTYESPLREEHARLTRQRILDAAVAAISEAGAASVTMADVAKRAGVSEPTLYRHFGSRDRLYEELDTHAHAALGLPPMPTDLEGMAATVHALFAKFEANAPLLEAAMQAGVAGEMRARGRAKRFERIRELVAARAPSLDERSVRAATAALRVLGSWESWRRMTGELGMSTEEASDAVAWASDALVKAIVESAKAKKSKLKVEGGER